MEFIQSFLSEALVAIATFALGWLARIAYQRYQTTRPAHRVWQFKDGDSVLIVTPNPSGYVEEEFSDTVYPTDYTAIAELRGFLRQVYPRLDVSEYFAQEFPSQRIGEHVILIGGEDINPVTEMVLKRLRASSLPLVFEDDYITDRGEGDKAYRPETLFDPSTRRSEIIKDYALVLGMPNPFQSEKRLYILAGCYVHGNLAAVKAMIEPMIRQVNHRLAGDKQFICLVETQVLRRYVGNIGIVRFYTFSKGQSKWVPK